jgi:hypothetical protein
VDGSATTFVLIEERREGLSITSGLTGRRDYMAILPRHKQSPYFIDYIHSDDADYDFDIDARWDDDEMTEEVESDTEEDDVEIECEIVDDEEESDSESSDEDEFYDEEDEEEDDFDDEVDEE